MFGLWPLEQIVEKRGYPGDPPISSLGFKWSQDSKLTHTHTDTHSFAHRLQTIENFTFYDAAQFVAVAKTQQNS